MIGGLPADEAKWAIDARNASEIHTACLAHEAADGKEHEPGHGIHPFAFISDRLHLHELGEHLREHPDPHSINGYPCQLPDGRMGRTAFTQVEGQWVAVCMVEV